MSIIEKLGITPGPWEVTGAYNHLIGADYTINSSGILCELWPSPIHKYSKPDAKLISAAPDLLSVLIELMACSQYWSEYDVPIGIQDRIKTAVEKAAGRTADEVMEMYNA